jgi:outer membrane protein TolC
VQYALAQKHIIDDIVGHLQFIHDRVQKVISTGLLPEWTEYTLDGTRIFLDGAKSRQIDAVNGQELGLAALREALGADPRGVVAVVEQPLPYPKPAVDREAILEAALAVRSELQQVAAATAAAHLEVAAQGRAFGRIRVPTFAAYADIHMQPIPPSRYDHRYRPAAIVVAMPTALAGHRPDRVAIARELDERTVAVADKTRNLVALEATEAYLNWDTAARKLELLIDTDQTAARIIERAARELRAPVVRTLENLLSHMVVGEKARADFNEALFNYVLSLADLERITGGVFDAGLITTAPAMDPFHEAVPGPKGAEPKDKGKE